MHSGHKYSKSKVSKRAEVVAVVVETSIELYIHRAATVRIPARCERLFWSELFTEQPSALNITHTPLPRVEDILPPFVLSSYAFKGV